MMVMGDNIGLPDRTGARTPMQWADEPNAGFSTKMILTRKNLPMMSKGTLEWLEDAPRSAPCFWRCTTSPIFRRRLCCWLVEKEPSKRKASKKEESGESS